MNINDIKKILLLSALVAMPSLAIAQAGGNPPAYCNDGTKNYDETDVDCGGTSCPKCVNGKVCSKNLDCVSANCDLEDGGALSCRAQNTMLQTATVTVSGSCPTSGTDLYPTYISGTRTVSCQRLQIDCPGANPAYALVNKIEPVGGAPTGLITMLSSHKGQGYYANIQSSNIPKDLILALTDGTTNKNFRVVDVLFEEANGTNSGWVTNSIGKYADDTGLLNSACRVAALEKYLVQNSSYAVTNGPACIIGHSIGSAAASFAVSRFQAGSYLGLDSLVLSGGPPAARVDLGCAGGYGSSYTGLSWLESDGTGDCADYITTNSTFDRNTSGANGQAEIDKTSCYYDAANTQGIINAAQGGDSTKFCVDTNQEGKATGVLTSGNVDQAKVDYLRRHSVLSTDADISIRTPINFIYGRQDAKVTSGGHMSNAATIGLNYRDALAAITANKIHTTWAGDDNANPVQHHLPTYTAGKDAILARIADPTYGCTANRVK